MPLINMKQVQGGKELQGDVRALLNIVGKDKDAFFNEILNWLLAEAPEDFSPEILRSSKLVKLVSSAVTVNNELDVPTKTPYLSFVEENNEPFTLKTSGKNWNGMMEYSVDTQKWIAWSGAEIKSSNDGKLYLRGKRNTTVTTNLSTSNGVHFTFSLNKRIQCLGNIENLLDYEIVAEGKHPTMQKRCYYYLFASCPSLTTPPELPATTLTEDCYCSMFAHCTSLSQAPILPATTLAESCYSSMFTECISLTQAPELPATTLAYNCYSNIFNKCTSLTGTIHCPASTVSDPNRLDAKANSVPDNTATVVYDL